MAQSSWYRMLSALLLLVIVFPVFPVEALPQVEAAEAGSAMAAPEAAAAPDLAVPRPAGEAGDQQPAVLQEGLFANWKVPNPAPAAAPLREPRLGEGYVFVALDGYGVARWNGSQWDVVNTNLNRPCERNVRQIAADPFDPNILLIATANGVFRTEDALDTCTWSPVLPYSSPISDVLSIVAVPWQRGKFFAGSMGASDPQEAPRFLTTTDGGNTWSQLELPLIGDPPARYYWGGPGDICLGLGSENVIYMPDQNANDENRPFWKSTTGGSSFAIVPGLDDRLFDCATEPGNDNVVYMANWLLVRSIDGGGSWDDKRPYERSYYDVEVNPFDFRLWTVGQDQNEPPLGRAFWSDNRGDAWTPIPLTMGEARTIGFGAPGEVWIGEGKG